MPSHNTYRRVLQGVVPSDLQEVTRWYLPQGTQQGQSVLVALVVWGIASLPSKAISPDRLLHLVRDLLGH